MKRVWFVLVLACGLFSVNAHASGKVAVIAHNVSNRIITLSDMGLTEAVTLGERNSEQHFYLPMPQGIPLKSAVFKLVATYLQPFAGNAVLTVSVNGDPVLMRKLESSITPIEIVLPLANAQPKAGILDVSVALSTQADASRCFDQRGKGIELSLDTHNTSLIYAFEHGAVSDIRTMLSTLPHRPAILLPSNALSQAQYESTLRMLLALSGMGLQPELLAVPKVGEIVTVDGLMASAAMSDTLRLAVQNKKLFKIQDKQDVGAWLLARMNSPNGLAQIVLDPVETRRALLTSIAESGMNELPGRLGSPEQWLHKEAKGNSNIELMQLAGYPVLGVGGGDAAKAVKLISTEWKQIAISSSLDVASAVDMNNSKEGKSNLHFAKDFPLRVLTADGEWVVPFNLHRLPKGRWPDAFELNMLAAPSSGGQSPVASVLLNDNLLTAALLGTNGKMTRITARIPLYALRANNMLKVRVGHRVESGLCSGVSQSIPVQLLPSSFLSLTGLPNASQFFMLEPALANHGDIIVPKRYLQDSALTLPAVSAFLNGLSVGFDNFVLQTSVEKSFVPKGVFVSFEIEPDDVSELVSTRSGHLIVRNAQGKAVLDSAGMGELAVMQLVQSHRQSGVYITTVTGRMPIFNKPLDIGIGSLAIADAQGTRLVVNLDDPDGDLELDEQNLGVKLFIHHYRTWIIVLVVLLLPVIAILGLRFYYSRRNLPT
ncbi:MAG: hypothetical protein PHD65_08815 [Gallionella sp.]|nr:hypothetical protein [Gallionella sp.]